MAVTLIASTSGAGGATTGTTSAIDTTGADCIVVHAASWDQGPDVTITDSKSNTPYTALTARQNGGPKSQLFYFLTPTVGSGHTFTVAAGGSTIYACLQVFAFADVTAYESQNGATGITSPQSCGSVTPAGNGALIVVGLAHDQPRTISAPTSFTGLLTVAGVGGVNFSGAAAYYVQPTAAAINPAWTWTGGSQLAVAADAVFTGVASSVPLRTSVIFLG